MAKTKKPAPPVKQPPLHVELSPDATESLNQIRARHSWNKKTAVEMALKAFDLPAKTEGAAK